MSTLLGLLRQSLARLRPRRAAAPAQAVPHTPDPAADGAAPTEADDTLPHEPPPGNPAPGQTPSEEPEPRTRLPRRALWLGAAALALLALGAGAAALVVSVHHARSLEALEASKRLLEEENRRLRAQTAIIPAPAAAPAAAPAVAPAVAAPAAQTPPSPVAAEPVAAPVPPARGRRPVVAECQLGSVDEVLTDLRPCIDRFNRASRP